MQVNHRLESRVRENRPHGSEGGEAGQTGLSYPYLPTFGRYPDMAKRSAYAG